MESTSNEVATLANLLATLTAQNALILQRLDAVEKKSVKTPAPRRRAVAPIDPLVSGTESDTTTSTTTSTGKKTKGKKQTKWNQEDCCVAIVWGNFYSEFSGFPLRCQTKRKEGTNYCTTHFKKSLESTEPCSYNEEGKPYGLFFGTLEGTEQGEESLADLADRGYVEDAPFQDEEGNVCVMWKGPPTLVAKIKKALDEGAKFHPFSPEGKSKSGTTRKTTTKKTTSKKPDNERQVALAEQAIADAIMETVVEERSHAIECEDNEPYETFELGQESYIVFHEHTSANGDQHAKRGDVYLLLADDEGDLVPTHKKGVYDYSKKKVVWN